MQFSPFARDSSRYVSKVLRHKVTRFHNLEILVSPLRVKSPSNNDDSPKMELENCKTLSIPKLVLLFRCKKTSVENDQMRNSPTECFNLKGEQ